jgi:CBS domain-containing protein
MERQGDAAVVVVDPASQIPLGVLTASDLLRHIGLDRVSPDLPVAALMRSGVATVPADAPIQRAATLMARRDLRHVVLTEADGRFAGLVARQDLYSPATSQIDGMVGAICNAPNLDRLIVLAGDVRSLAAELLHSGVRADAVCHGLSTLNDLIGLRIIDLIEPQYDLPIIPWCWLLFGSEGRYEQTLFTDQDNGIIFIGETDSPAENDRLRQAFLPFANAVNCALDACGFPLCKGGIMASNPRWCLSLGEWMSCFRSWLAQPEPDALLNASIFFDFRSLYGPDEPVRRLRDFLFGQAPSSGLCLRLMAINALDIAPPLARWRSGFRFDDAEHPKSIDLKRYGSRLFVDAARVFALSEGIAATGTVPRLREFGDRAGLAPGEVAGFTEAFYVLQRLRLELQSRLSAPDQSKENRVWPENLSEIDRQLLRESLLQARRLQQRARLHLHIE